MAIISVKEMGDTLVAGPDGAMKVHSNIFDTSDLAIALKHGSGLYATANASVMKRVKIEVFYNQDPENRVRIDSTDTKTGKKNSLFCNYPEFAPRAVTALQQGDSKTIRAIGKLDRNNTFPDLLLEEWKNGRCLFQGVPNKAAMLLLCGLQRDFPAPLAATKDGTAYRGGTTIQSLREANLLDVVMKRPTRAAYRTNLRGYEVLRVWAERSPAFNGYLNAFLPKNWEQGTKARAALEAMHSGANELLEYSHSVGYITPVMKKLGIR
jgi:hypothetical protein